MKSNSTIISHQVTYLTIQSEQAGQRIDNFLITHFKGVPKSHVYRILRKGEVRINKGRVKPTYRLKSGDYLRLPPIRLSHTEKTTPHEQALQTLQQSILHEDKYLIVINKPAGMAVHGGSGISYGVIEGLRALYPQARFLELVHRLDRDTSGCLMIAKKRSILNQLHNLLRSGHNIKKEYLALVKGRWKAHKTKVDAPLEKNILQSGERIVKVTPEGKTATSQFHLEKQYAMASLVKVSPITGRTHQIRVHAQYAGHPILGDTKYGDETMNQKIKQYGLKRLFLHASRLEIHLPESDYHLSMTAPLPPVLQEVLQNLENANDK